MKFVINIFLLTFCLFYGIITQAQTSELIEELPNGRRVLPEGYVLSGMIDESHVNIIDNLGISLVISAQNPGTLVIEALESRGISWTLASINSTFDQGYEIMFATLGVDAEEILIHCQHGRNRSSAILAFLLVQRHMYSIPDAFYSVVNDDELDISNLERILGFPPNENLLSKFAGPDGGMLVRPGGFNGTGFFNLVRSTINEMVH